MPVEMTLVAGVDSSTQSCKVVIRDAASGALVRHGSAKHPDGTEIDPAHWERAFHEAVAAAGGVDELERHFDAVAVGLIEDQLPLPLERVVRVERAGDGRVGNLLDADGDMHGVLLRFGRAARRAW